LQIGGLTIAGFDCVIDAYRWTDPSNVPIQSSIPESTDLKSIINLQSQHLQFFTWLISVGFVVLSAFCAWREGNWRRRDGLEIGFVDHGGMWGDLLLLPIVNAAIVPWLSFEPWLIGPVLIGVTTSWWLHARWHRGDGDGFWREHLWPTRADARWHRNLSWAGWLHVVYVAVEMTLLIAYALTPVPNHVILIVSLVLTLHVPLGLLAPAWVATGGRVIVSRLLWPAVAMVWIVAITKVFGPP
jgi:hypothetical protein